MSQRSQVKYGSNNNNNKTMAIETTDMEGVEAEVSQLSVQDNEDQDMSAAPTSSSSSKRVEEDEVMRGRNDGDDDEDDCSAVPGLSEDEGSDLENDDDVDEVKNKGHRSLPHDTQEVLVDDQSDAGIVAEAGQQQQPYQSESAASSTTSLNGQPSIISLPEGVYSAVSVSSELYIIPHSSKGFQWNKDLFMKPHQRRTLGVDDMYSADSGSGSNGDSNNDGRTQEPGVFVHEIRLDEDDLLSSRSSPPLFKRNESATSSCQARYITNTVTLIIGVKKYSSEERISSQHWEQEQL
ncbi:hypothetical protein EDD21DRAFT_418151 [Dissophora ornata]|nr:hypothetical protein EDD21DRAFT_418151 [Dissophora ornata]